MLSGSSKLPVDKKGSYCIITLMKRIVLFLGPVLALLLFVSPVFAAINNVVTNCSADPLTSGSLPWAVAQANSNGRPIDFNIPGSEPDSTGEAYPGKVTCGADIWYRIIIDSALQITNNNIVINGSTQPASNSKGPEIEVRTNGAYNALSLDGTAPTVEGLVINRASGTGSIGIVLNDGADGAHIYNCYVGTTATGEAPAPGKFYNGVSLSSVVGARIGGTTAPERNVISNNAFDGIALSGSSNNLIIGNHIGTNYAGDAAIANLLDGIYLATASGNNTIGGSTGTPGTGAGNLISGNVEKGIYMVSGNGNKISGNIIGLNKAGDTKMANGNNFSGQGGIYVYGQSHIIGGVTAGEGNIISGNNGDGIHINGSATRDNKIWGNYIGTNLAGSSALNNSANGINLYSQANNNLIGSTESGGRNVISGNTNSGIQIHGDNVVGGDETGSNEVIGNYIGLNAAGTAAVPNDLGIYIDNKAVLNRIGNGAANGRNIVSGNAKEGIFIFDVGTDHNEVLGNYIGTNVGGTAAVPNCSTGGSGGVYIGDGSNNRIGGNVSGEGNLISGNTQAGVYLSGPSNEVYGNLIGTNASGAGPITNESYGIRVSSASYNKIGNGTVAGRNVISGNGDSGITLSAANSNEVMGNLIGTNGSGTSPMSNISYGIYISNSSINNKIGDGSDGGRNIISGNTSAGIRIDNNATGNRIKGNYIGTNISGSSAIANWSWGIILSSSARNYIGGSGAGDGNVVSGNSNYGVQISNSNSNEVKGNKIGVNATASAALFNLTGLIITDTSSYNIVGGSTTNEANIISGNNYDGVRLLGTAHHNEIKGNYIGTNPAGASDLMNHWYGVVFDDTSPNNVIGPDNVIAYNGEGAHPAGIMIPATCSKETITRNSFYANYGNGIVLAAGANDAIATPEISVTGYSQLTGLLQLVGTAEANATVEVFKAQGNQGKTYLGRVTANGSGVINGSLTYLGLVSGDVVTATQTNPLGSTSTFSLTREVVVTTTFMYQPDAMVGLLIDGSDYKTEGVFENTPATQVQSTAVATNETAVVYFKLKNAGNTPDSFFVSGEGSSGNVAVRYYDAKTAGTDITTSITAGGIAPFLFASGASIEIRAELTNSGTDLTTKEITLTLVSSADAARKDAVQAVATFTVSSSTTTTTTSTTTTTLPARHYTESDLGVPGMTVDVPAGATSGPVTVTASAGDAPPSGSTPPAGFSVGGKTYELGPTGTTFLTPVTITIPLTGALKDPHIYYWTGTAWSTAGITVISSTATSLTFTTTHFSSFAPMGAIPSNLVRFGPNPYNPANGNGHFWYWLDANADTQIYLADLGGSLVWKQSYTSGTNGGLAGANNITFDGKSAWGDTLGNGAYIYKIVQGGKSIGGGKIAIIK
jgi:parallel beta-helix repeat protein